MTVEFTVLRWEYLLRPVTRHKMRILRTPHLLHLRFVHIFARAFLVVGVVPLETCLQKANERGGRNKARRQKMQDTLRRCYIIVVRIERDGQTAVCRSSHPQRPSFWLLLVKFFLVHNLLQQCAEGQVGIIDINHIVHKGIHIQ